MYLIKKLFLILCCVMIVCAPNTAYADNLVDALNLAPLVPMVLDAFMMVATGGYEFFVGNGDGIIYILIWTFLFITVVLELVKMYMPNDMLKFFGISGGGDIAKGIAPAEIVKKVAKPGMRAVIAVLLLLQLKPTYLTQWLVNPFLQLGAIYTNQITNTINSANINADKIACPQDILDKAWISPESCEFLVQPVADLSRANNTIIKRGFNTLLQGLRGLMTPIPHGGEDFMNVLTGIILIITFVACNLFMALLIIQGIFNFGMQLILYPFYVLTYVTKNSDKWFDVWPAFSGITKALQQLIVTMIACAFILCINLAVINALFQTNKSVFVTTAGGSAYGNIPTSVAGGAMGFGTHSVTWLSAILTFFLMFKIFDMTRKQLDMYVGSGMDGLYNKLRGDAGTLWGGVKKTGTGIATAMKWIKK